MFRCAHTLLALAIFFIFFVSPQLNARVFSGLEVFLAKYTHFVKGKRVGLVTNQTGVNFDKVSTIDIFHKNPSINLVALFAPEHGIRGDIAAGETVPGGKDPKTGLPIYTLYGPQGHRPTKEALSKIDVLVFDIQDVGSRAYTYIWHMAECMSAVAEAGKEMIVLDRPNPLGATAIDGPIVSKELRSFIGLYPIPRVYGLTIGELAYYLNNEEKINCALTIIPMYNYRRGTPWEKTGLPWIPPSPNIPDVKSAYCFAATGTIGEMSLVNIGIGTKYSFQIIAAPWLDSKKTASALNALALPGVVFTPFEFTPEKGMFAKQKNHAVLIDVKSPQLFRPATVEIAIICHLKKAYPSKFAWTAPGKQDRLKMIDKAIGNSKVRAQIDAGLPVSKIAAEWQTEIENFRIKSRKYLIYK